MKIGTHKRHFAVSLFRWGIAFRLCRKNGCARWGARLMWQRKRFGAVEKRQGSLVFWSRVSRKGSRGTPHTIQFSVFTS